MCRRFKSDCRYSLPERDPPVKDFRFPFTIPVDSSRLFAVCHLPVQQSSPSPVVVMCHGLGGNKVGKGRFSVLLSEQLAQHGIASVRFDFRGNGDSEGEFSSITSGRCLADLQSVIRWVEEQPAFDLSRCALFGRSFGGLIAILGAAQWKACRTIAVLSPPFNVELFSSVLAQGALPHLQCNGKDGVLLFEGEPLTSDFIEQLQAIDMKSVLQTVSHMPFLHISCGRDMIVDGSHTEHYRKCREEVAAVSRFVIIEEADHGCSKYGDRQTALKESTDWFISQLYPNNLKNRDLPTPFSCRFNPEKQARYLL